MCERVCCYLCIADWCKASVFPRENESGGYDYVEPAYLEGVYKYKQSYNIYPSASVPVLTRSSHFLKESPSLKNVIVAMRWGILPHWGSVAVFGSHNTKVETVMANNVYKPEYQDNRRCVILCNGYYEWLITNTKEQPFYLYPEKVVRTEAGSSGSYDCPEVYNERPILKLAGLFNIKASPEGMIYSATMLTRDADAKLAWMNSRMPIILDSYSDVDLWLNYEHLNGQEGIEFIQNYTRKEDKFCLQYYPVDNKIVNDATCQSEICIKRLYLKRKATLDGW